MDGNNSESKQDSTGEDRQSRADDRLRQLIRERDVLTPSPEVRARFILDLIQDHNKNVTNWDLLCFCSEYLASQILVYPWLGDDHVRAIASIVQHAHYLRDEIPETGVI